MAAPKSFQIAIMEGNFPNERRYFNFRVGPKGTPTLNGKIVSRDLYRKAQEIYQELDKSGR